MTERYHSLLYLTPTKRTLHYKSPTDPTTNLLTVYLTKGNPISTLLNFGYFFKLRNQYHFGYILDRRARFDKGNYEPYHCYVMKTKVLAKKIKQDIREPQSNDADYIYLKIRRDTLEAFCNAAGLYRQEFLDLLDKSEKDHRASRVTKRKSLYELIQ